MTVSKNPTPPLPAKGEDAYLRGDDTYLRGEHEDLRRLIEQHDKLIARTRAIGAIVIHASALLKEALWRRPPCYPQWCLHLLEHPDLINPDWREEIVNALDLVRGHVAVIRPLGPSDIAALVDWLQFSTPLEDSRRAIAASTGRSHDAVKKAHQRHGGGPLSTVPKMLGGTQ